MLPRELTHKCFVAFSIERREFQLSFFSYSRSTLNESALFFNLFIGFERSIVHGVFRENPWGECVLCYCGTVLLLLLSVSKTNRFLLSTTWNVGYTSVWKKFLCIAQTINLKLSHFSIARLTNIICFVIVPGRRLKRLLKHRPVPFNIKTL